MILHSQDVAVENQDYQVHVYKLGKLFRCTQLDKYHTCDLSILQTLGSRPPQSCPFNVMTFDTVVSIQTYSEPSSTTVWVGMVSIIDAASPSVSSG